MGICLCISDSFTFAVSIVGIVLSLIYICHELCRSVKEPNYDKGLEDALVKWLEKEESKSHERNLNIILKDYEIANSEIGRRDNITLLVGTILVTSSLLILGNVVKDKSQNPIGIYAFASVGLFLIFLFVLHDTAKKMNVLSYDRIKAIEQALTQYLNPNRSQECKDKGYDFGIHSYLHKKTNGQRIWWLLVRRTFWTDVLLLLSLAWMLISIT